jgi:hypothetical protein
MSVVFRAHIQNNPTNDGWVICLTDTVKHHVEICQNLDEFAARIEIMGDECGGDIQVFWSKDDSLSQAHFDDLYNDMARFQKDT